MMKFFEGRHAEKEPNEEVLLRQIAAEVGPMKDKIEQRGPSLKLKPVTRRRAALAGILFAGFMAGSRIENPPEAEAQNYTGQIAQTVVSGGMSAVQMLIGGGIGIASMHKAQSGNTEAQKAQGEEYRKNQEVINANQLEIEGLRAKQMRQQQEGQIEISKAQQTEATRARVCEEVLTSKNLSDEQRETARDCRALLFHEQVRASR